MSCQRPTLSIAHTRDPLRVIPERLTDDMYVPNIGRHHALEADERPGDVAARLFELAEAEGAIAIHDDLCVHCYGDDDQEGGGFILVAYPKPREARVGITCGWRDVDTLTRGEDGREDNDPAAVQAALEFMVAEVNAALRGQAD